MLKAIIFDCDGIIADTEPLHFAALTKTLAEESIEITKDEYDSEYLSFDDRGCFKKAFSKVNLPISDEKINRLIARKASYFDPFLNTHLQIFPGVIPFVLEVSRHYPLAIASGARRDEIQAILNFAKLSPYFKCIVSTEDVVHGKPDPESFLKALTTLQSSETSLIRPENCLVIEDSVHGVNAAHLAGMLCLAVTNSYPREKLSHADLIVDRLDNLAIHEIEALFKY